MGEIVVDLGLENVGDRELAKAGYLPEADIRRATVKAVADTGAVMLALPEDVVERLGVAVVGAIACTYADGRRGERPVAGPSWFASATAGCRPTASSCRPVPTRSSARSSWSSSISWPTARRRRSALAPSPRTARC